MNEDSKSKDVIQKNQEANSCIALGAGVGVLGAAAAAVTGAVCPLCVFIAPGLVSLGAYKKWQAIKEDKKLDPVIKQ